VPASQANGAKESEPKRTAAERDADGAGTRAADPRD
jgi:hypothetical protein